MIWQKPVYWGSGRYIGDQAGIMGIWQIYIRDLEGIVYWGTGSYIGDLAGI